MYICIAHFCFSLTELKQPLKDMKINLGDIKISPELQKLSDDLKARKGSNI